MHEEMLVYASMVVVIVLAFAFGRSGVTKGLDLEARLRSLDPWLAVLFAGLCV